jgi:hypothetical protein
MFFCFFGFVFKCMLVVTLAAESRRVVCPMTGRVRTIELECPIFAALDIGKKKLISIV